MLFVAVAGVGFPRRGLLVAPCNAMWQLWGPDDMLYYVDTYGKPGDAESVLAAMDKCASTSWMMNMGPAKGELVEAAFEGRKSVLEIGTFLGYMAIRISRTGARLTTIEIDGANYEAARRIMAAALGDDLDGVRTIHASARDLLLAGSVPGAPFDAVLMDHWKADYPSDLDLLKTKGLLAPGALVVADNVLFPGAPDLLDYLGVDFEKTHDSVSGMPCLAVNRAANWRTSDFSTVLVSSPFEYRPETPDALAFATYTPRRRHLSV
ncbi:hypothetical protein CTAYLR_005641 [Chrysophaeum taylorii]|uniref:catechol O-methyltransferase n=1 Tax=Chrysophaeum taylorii TaxID=2483200 RepID=A0AAD7XNG5_9STRA|nr:hypothetical protein CTAYLR_005641 [Chrysophaeum taylorii]